MIQWNSSRKNQHNNHINNSSNSKNRGKPYGGQYNNYNKDNNKLYCHIYEVKGHSTKNCNYNRKKKME